MDINTSRLIACRNAKGLSQKKAAELIGVSQAGYLRYESGERKPRVTTLQAIARVLGTSEDYLLGLTDIPTPSEIIISEAEQPVLFDLVRNALSDKDVMRRLEGYYNRLNKN